MIMIEKYSFGYIRHGVLAKEVDKPPKVLVFRLVKHF